MSVMLRGDNENNVFNYSVILIPFNVLGNIFKILSKILSIQTNSMFLSRNLVKIINFPLQLFSELNLVLKKENGILGSTIILALLF